MENRISMKDNLKNLKSFIIKRFGICIVFIAFSERAVSFFYDSVVFPYLEKAFTQSNIQVEYSGKGMLLGVCSYLVLIILNCLLQMLPELIAEPAQYVLRELSFKIFHIDSGAFILKNGAMPFEQVYNILIIIVLIILLLIAILPYGIAIIVFGKMVSDKVEEQERKLEKQRSLLLADIAHDLKTPLTTITGYTQVLKDEIETDEAKKQQYLNIIYGKSVKLDEMVSLLFEYVKLESDGFTVKREETDLCELLRENVAMLYTDFEQKGIELIIKIPEQAVKFLTDKMQLSRAITNLLNNALKHNEAGDTVTVELARENDIQIIVGDTGKQISNEIAKHIFEPFAMGDASRNSKNGSGLGLSIAAKIVTMHGGSIELNRISTDEYTKAFVIHL